VTMAVLDGTDDLLEEPTSFVFWHLEEEEGGKGREPGQLASKRERSKEQTLETNLSFLQRRELE